MIRPTRKWCQHLPCQQLVGHRLQRKPLMSIDCLHFFQLSLPWLLLSPLISSSRAPHRKPKQNSLPSLPQMLFRYCGRHPPQPSTLTSTTGVPHAPSTSDSADVTTLHLETSTATPGNTTAHGGRATTPYSKSTPTMTTPTMTTMVGATRNHTVKTTEMGMTTTPMPFKSTASPGMFDF